MQHNSIPSNKSFENPSPNIEIIAGQLSSSHNMSVLYAGFLLLFILKK